MFERETWSSGYGRRLTIQRSWVRIPAPYTGWTWHFFTLICCKNCNNVCLKRPKINEKESRVGPFFFKKTISYISNEKHIWCKAESWSFCKRILSAHSLSCTTMHVIFPFSPIWFTKGPKMFLTTLYLSHLVLLDNADLKSISYR